MANYLASGTTGAAGADFTLASGASTTLSLSAAQAVTPRMRADIQIKAADASYQSIGTLDLANPVRVLAAVGTFRVVRAPGSEAAFGIERD